MDTLQNSTPRTDKQVTDNYCFTCLKIGDKYNADYVNKLQNMVRQYSDAPFLCFTDDPTGVDLSLIQI